MQEHSGAPVHPGDVLAGKYRVEQILGLGGMGVVVAATHIHLRDRVALKFLLPSVTQRPDHVARFLREAQAVVKIKSAHVARVTDVGTLETGAPYIVMEYLDGADLGRVLDTHGRLPLEEALLYVLQACEALAEAHTFGIVHRDLKPANMFLTRANDGSPCLKILDFGISKLLEQGGVDSLTHTQTPIGSPLYMSPEQMRSARKTETRSDIWSLGVTLYELLVGATPFIAESMVELCALVLETDPPLLRTVLPSAPESVEAVIARCLQKNPNDRYPTVGPLADDIASILGTNEAFASAARTQRILSGAGAERSSGTSDFSSEPRIELRTPSVPPPSSQKDFRSRTTQTSTGVSLEDMRPSSKRRHGRKRGARLLWFAAALALLLALGGAAMIARSRSVTSVAAVRDPPRGAVAPPAPPPVPLTPPAAEAPHEIGARTASEPSTPVTALPVVATAQLSVPKGLAPLRRVPIPQRPLLRRGRSPAASPAQAPLHPKRTRSRCGSSERQGQATSPCTQNRKVLHCAPLFHRAPRGRKTTIWSLPRVPQIAHGRPQPWALRWPLGHNAGRCGRATTPPTAHPEGRQGSRDMKKITGYVKLQLPAGKANPSPPVGPALGQHGVNIMAFCKEFNAKTAGSDMIIPVVITVYSDRSFTFITKTPPASVLLKKEAGLPTNKKPGAGSKEPNKNKVGSISKQQLEELAKLKIQDMNCGSVEAAMRTISGTARSMGIEIKE